MTLKNVIDKMNQRSVPGVLSKAQSSLRFGQTKSAGRNSSGGITVFHRGGGSKRVQRRIDFRRQAFGSGLVERLEYDPNRSSRIALIRWSGLTHRKPPATSSNCTHVLDDTEPDDINHPSLPSEPGVTTPPWYEEALGGFATTYNIALSPVVSPNQSRWSLSKRLGGVQQRSFFSYILAGDQLRLGDEVMNVHQGEACTVDSPRKPLFQVPRLPREQPYTAKDPGSLYAFLAGFTKGLRTKWTRRLPDHVDTPAPLHTDPSVLRRGGPQGMKVKPPSPTDKLRRYAPPWWTAVSASSSVKGQRAVFLRPSQRPSDQKEQAPTAAVPSSPLVYDMAFYQGVGNCGPLSHMPIGTCIHNIEWHPGQGAKGVRAGGTFAQLVQKDSTLQCVVRLPSGHEQKLDSRCRATIGIVSVSNQTRKLRKAGQSRWLGRRPVVRGVAMNPVDHPHGGGEGRTKGGRPSVSPWGKPTKGGFKTVMRKRQPS